MSNPDLTAFLHKVDRIIQAHEDPDDRLLAEHALTWLCVAQRPLRTHEIVDALETYYRIDETSKWLLDELKLTELKGEGDVVAGRYLQTLLPNLCAVRGDHEDCDVRYANLEYPVMGAGWSEAAPLVVPPNIKEAILALLMLSVERAHRLVAIDCMKICSEGTLHAGHVLEDAEASPLLPYAWSHWVTHLSLANVSQSGVVGKRANAMIRAVAKDTLVLLLAINDFLVNPIRVRGTASRVGALALIQQAQKDLERPLVLLSTLARKERYFDIVISARKAAMPSPNPGATASQTTPNVSAASGTVGRTAEANPESTSQVENGSTPKTCSALPMTDTVYLGPSVSPHTRQITAEEQERRDSEVAKTAAEETALEALECKKAKQRTGKLLRSDQAEVDRLTASLERRYAERAARDAAGAESAAPAVETVSDPEPGAQPVPEAPSNDEEQDTVTPEEQRCNELSTATRLLLAEEKQIIRTFAEVAQGLRALCLSLANPILYDELLRHVDEAWSPMNVLAQTAMLMEQMGGYASCEDLRVRDGPDVKDPFEISDPTDTNYLNAGLVRHYLSDHDNSGHGMACQCCRIVRTTSTASVNKPAGVFTLRWRAALAVAKLKGFVRVGWNAGGTVIINDHRLGRRSSSFPSHLYMPPSDQLRYIASWTPQSVRHFVRSRMAWLPGWTSFVGLVAPLRVFSSGAFTLGDAPRWTQLKSALLVSGYRVALVHGIFAILVNHLRRFFVPWLGAFMFHHPMEDLRLALSNPDMLLQQSLSYTWTGACFSFLQRWAFDVVALVVMRLVALNNGRPPIDMVARPNAHQDGIMHLAKIFCWIYGFVTCEYIFSRGLHTVNLLIALSKLVTGGEHAHLALLSLIQTHWTHIPLLVLLTRYYLHHAFSPVIRGSISSAVRGRPALLLTLAAVVAGVVATLRLRSKLGFLWLELSNLFLMLGLLVMVIMLLGYEFVRDPLGLQGSTAWARRCGVEARKSLPDGAEERVRSGSDATREAMDATKMD